MIDRAPDMEWASAGACRGSDPELWFPESPVHLPLACAEICDPCSVRGECLDHALHHEAHGIWAATTERDRRKLRRLARIELITPGLRVRGIDIDDTEGAEGPADLEEETA